MFLYINHLASGVPYWIFHFFKAETMISDSVPSLIYKYENAIHNTQNKQKTSVAVAMRRIFH